MTNSLFIAFASTIVATILGTLIALALVRHRFRGRAATNLLIFLPMSTPEIVLGSSLLTLFIASNQFAFIPENTFFPLGMHTILIAHIMFNISFVVVVVKARVEGFPRNLEEAALDLYANDFETFRRVTFPLILPGILAAALLAFSLSIDDFVITNFTAGADEHVPALHLRGPEDRRAGPGQRHRLGHLPDRRRRWSSSRRCSSADRTGSAERRRLPTRPKEFDRMIDTRPTAAGAATQTPPRPPRRRCPIGRSSRPSGAGSPT